MRQAVVDLLQPVRQAYLQQGVLRDAKRNVRILRTEVRQHLQRMHRLSLCEGQLSCLMSATLGALHMMQARQPIHRMQCLCSAT